MKSIIRLLILASLGLSHIASAICLQLTDEQIAGEVAADPAGYTGYKTLSRTVLFPESTVSINPDLPNGSLIATGTTGALAVRAAIVRCVGGGSMTAPYTPSPLNPVPAYPDYYETNVQGIGFRIRYIRSDGTPVDFPLTLNIAPETGNTPATYGVLERGSRFDIELIKTGDLSAGQSIVEFTGYVSTGHGNDGKTVLTIGSGSVRVKILPSCKVDSSDQNIDFGTFGPSDVSATAGPTRSVDFTVRCTGPTPPASITAMLDGTADLEDSSMLKNNGATHLAIRLKEISSGTVLRPGDATSTITHVPAGNMQSPFSLEATVLRVGSATPTVGKIQATATIVMTVL